MAWGNKMPMMNTIFNILLSSRSIIAVLFFKASTLWADAFYRLKCPSVCPSVGLFTFEVPFKRLFAPTYQSRMSNNFRDSDSLEKSMKRSGLRFENFSLEVVKHRRAKKSVFLLILPTKHGGNHTSRWIRDFWSKGVLLILAYLYKIFEFLSFW